MKNRKKMFLGESFPSDDFRFSVEFFVANEHSLHQNTHSLESNLIENFPHLDQFSLRRLTCLCFYLSIEVENSGSKFN